MLIDRLGGGLAMRSRFLTLPPQTRQKLLRLKQEAEHSGCYRVARRLHAVLLNADGHTSGQMDLSGLVQQLGMVNRTDELSVLPVLSDKETFHPHGSGVFAIWL